MDSIVAPTRGSDEFLYSLDPFQTSATPRSDLFRNRAKANIGTGKKNGAGQPPRLFAPDLHVSRYSAETGERCSVFAPGSKRSAHGPAGMVVASSIM